MRRIKIALIGLVIAVIFFTAGGFFVAPPLLKALLLKSISERFHREVSIGKIDFNPYTFAVKLTGLTVKERGSSDTFLSFEELFCDVEVMPLFKKIIALQALRIKKPYLKIDRLDEKTFNFSDIIEVKEEKAQKEEEVFRFAMNSIVITDGSLDVWDGPKKTKHAITEVNLTVPFISNLPRHMETNVQAMLSLKVDGAPYIIQGKTKPFADSLETIFDINIKDLDIPHYLAYAPLKPNFKLLSAYLDVKARLSFMHYKKGPPGLTITGDMSLKKLAVNDLQNKPVIRLPALNLSIADLEPFAQRVYLSKVSLESPSIHVERFEDGRLSIESLLPAKKDELPAGPATAAPKTKEPQQQFKADIDSLQVTKGRLSFHDRSVADTKPMLIENLELKGEGISLEKGKSSKFSLSCVLNKKGNVALDGLIGMNPISSQAKVSLKNVDITHFQPYFTEKVKITVTGGALTVNGNISLQQAEGKGLSATFTGGASLDRFISVDKLNGEDFLKWNSLFFSKMQIGYNPTNISIEGVSLSDFYARVIIHQDGTLNIREAFTGETTKTEAPPPIAEKAAKTDQAEKVDVATQKKEEPIPIKIDTVTLQNGKIDFKDLWIKPNHAAILEEIGGRISGLSSQVNTMADIDLRGKFDRYAPLEITGKINPLREDLYVDLKVRFKDMELSPVTPYSGKYIGYAIEKGKLSFDLQYLINKRKLDSQNNIFIDQFTLGNRIESPDATKLPVRLAIALLKDRNGQIKLDIPVTGSLDDPQFSVWKIVLKILGNLLAKAATAPFALIGAMFGGGEELGYIEFDYGRESVTGASAKKVDTIAKALRDRPSLRVDIQGFVDIEKDREGLKQQTLERKVKAQKLKELAKKESAATSIDDVKIEPKEYEKYLRLAYKAEKFPKPKTAMILDKTLPVPEMEKLMYTNIVIKDDDLRLLATRRTIQVKDTLLKAGQVDSGRVFAIEPKSLTPEKKEKFRDSRVEFKLK
jgi:uncharacterized protein involved in outer membrane biogenesis